MMAVMKAWVLLFLNLLVQPIWAESYQSQVKPEKYKQGIIWQIKHPDSRPSYLMGTIHIHDSGVMALFTHARLYYEKAATVCTEIEINFKSMAAEMNAMYFQDGRNLKSVLNDNKLYKEFIYQAQSRGYPEVMLTRMKPMAAAIMLSMPKSDGRILDEYIFTEALRRGQSVCGLETMAEHTQIFDAFNMPMQIDMLRTTVKHIEEYDRQFPKLLSAYLNRDLQGLSDLMDESMRLHEPSLNELFIQRFLIDRNIKMAQRMQPLIEQGNAFFAVGAMHLIGSSGLLRLLEQKGYSVQKIY